MTISQTGPEVNELLPTELHVLISSPLDKFTCPGDLLSGAMDWYFGQVLGPFYP